ncbi:hypothetical protein JL722_3082 [Aureococcus anophagefferens]|nr:hypothetical protein JL722_3082 [Aureococcus anophagefferens]
MHCSPNLCHSQSNTTSRVDCAAAAHRTADNGKMGECEANSVHLSKREKFLAEQGKKA